MTETNEQTNLPAQIAGALADIPKALMPSCIKALDRLVSAAIDIPVAWLGQKTARIDAQTNAFKLVEASIASAAASLAEADPSTVQRAAEVLVRKAYRKQVNREAVATAMLEDLSTNPQTSAIPEQPVIQIDEDWLNVFERYAEDASTERMQTLWGRVLAGEVRKPGRYSMRTLRFLSEFSQADALSFSEFSNFAFGDTAPDKLVKPADQKDIRGLIYMESAGLIQGASGMGLTNTITLDSNGNGFLRESNLAIQLIGAGHEVIVYGVCAVTPLGQELLSLLPGRDARVAARNVAHAIRTPAIKAAFLGAVLPNGHLLRMEVLWQESGVEVEQPTP